jgi:membrane-associated phospholipid phosphatase
MESLVFTRQHVLFDVDANVVQSVGGFASLHTGITLLVALMIQATINNKIARWAGWINFGITVVATVYFGWHYLADDIAGCMIALVAYYFGGLAAGQKFQRKGVRRLVAESDEIADRESKVAHELT